MKDKLDLRRQARELQRSCLEGRLSPIETVEAINELVGGITRVDYKAGIKLKFWSEKGDYALDVHGLPKKYYKVVEAIAALGYRKAQENGNFQAGGVHAGRGASTKHYKDGIEAIIRRYAA